jgi:hypothetical protein
MSATPNWIVEIGSATPSTGGGGGDIPKAPAVTIVSATVTARSDGTQQIEVVYTPAAGANSTNYSGVDVFLEDPDISALPNAPLDGTTLLDGSAQLSGKWSPVIKTQSKKSPVTILVNGDTADRIVRIYLAAFGPNSSAQLVRANQPTPTPSIAVTVPKAAAQYVSGQEHCWQITNPQVRVNPAFDDPAGATYTLTFSYTPPDPSIPLPPGMEPFGGVDIWYGYLDGAGNIVKITPTGTTINVLSAGGYDSGPYSPGVGLNHFFVFFVSRGIDNQANTLVPGVTPQVLVTFTYPPLGQGIAPSISALAIGPSTYVSTPDGSVYEQATLSWTLPPSTPRYGGVFFYVTQIDGVPQAHPQQVGYADAHTTQLQLSMNQYGATAHAWTITAISQSDKNVLADDPANPQSYSPSVVWNVGPPGAPGGGGNEWAPLVNLTPMAAPVIDQQLSSDGVQMMRFTFTGWANPLATDPRVNQFGGVKLAMQDSNGTVYYDVGKATSFKTPWLPAVTAQTLKFFWVSYNPQGIMNSLLAGTTPERDVAFTANAGNIIPSRTTIWWSPEFTWPAGGAFSALVFNAVKINVGQQLIVGGAPNSFGGPGGGQVSNGQIAVLNSSAALVGWIGTQQPTQGNGAATYGAWFGQLWVGGHDPRDAPIWVNNQGIVIVGGIQYQSAGPPFISIRDQSGVEVGKMGAQLNLDSTGTPISGAPAIAGAWFNSFALGGPNLSNWKLLANNSDSTIKLRDVNLFQITWPTNSAGHTNYQTQLTFGLDAYLTNIAGSTFSFPGIVLVDQSSPAQNFGFALINRGLVLYGYQGYKRVSLVTFNGDSSGNNLSQTYFWGELAMYNPTDTAGAAPNVYLGSGYASGGSVIGDSSFYLRDRNGTENFHVDYVGACTARGGFFTEVRQVIDASGNWVGNPISTSGGVSSLNSQTGAVTISNTNANLTVTAGGGTIQIGINTSIINSSGAFVGAGVNVGTQGIGGGSLNVGSGPVTCGALTATTSVNTPALTATTSVTVGSTAVVNNSGQWIGKEILANGNIQTTSAFVVNSGGSFFGIDATIVVGAVTLYFKGGILYSHS